MSRAYHCFHSLNHFDLSGYRYSLDQAMVLLQEYIAPLQRSKDQSLDTMAFIRQISGMVSIPKSRRVCVIG